MKKIILENYSFDQFKAIWISQETDNTDDEERLVDALDKCEDFDELFDVIEAWSQIPIEQRLEKFLINNQIL